MKLFVAACFGTFILIMVLEFLAGLLSAWSGREKRDKQEEDQE